MNYSNYHTSIVERYKVKLVSWTYKDFVNPSKIGIIINICKLWDSLRSGLCYWVCLSQDKLQAHLCDIQTCQENGEDIGSSCHQCSDKGKACKHRIKSDNEDVENRPPAKKTKHGQKGREGLSTGADKRKVLSASRTAKKRQAESSSESESSVSLSA
jgi:hypothetical protein